jgi:hypothetical protein
MPNNFFSDEVVTCASCEYRYPRIQAVCNICGTPAPAIRPQVLTPETEIAQTENRRPAAVRGATGQSLRPKQAGLVVVAAVVTFALLSLVDNGRILPVGNSQSDVAAARFEQDPANVPSPGTVADVPDVRPPYEKAAKIQTAELASDASLDPAKLWQAVKRGSTHAEVTLAKLYLDGDVVEQSCEQAHLLLLVASKKGNGLAETLLTGAYAERCDRKY